MNNAAQQVVLGSREINSMIAEREVDKTIREMFLAGCPCDGCPAVRLCAATGAACTGYWLWLHGEPSYRWKRQPRIPTSWRMVHIDDKPKQTKRAATQRTNTIAKYQDAMIGKTFGGRLAVGLVRSPSGKIRVRLHCPECGRETTRLAAEVLREGAPPCVCHNGQWRRS